MSAAVESALLKKQWSLLTIRRSATVIASIFQSAGILGFALAKTPPIAAAMYVWCFASYGIHRSGFSANLLEVGGQVRHRSHLGLFPLRSIFPLNQSSNFVFASHVWSHSVTHYYYSYFLFCV